MLKLKVWGVALPIGKLMKDVLQGGKNYICDKPF
jgi:hypothetical protein